jgi:hypothetical protein
MKKTITNGSEIASGTITNAQIGLASSAVGNLIVMELLA